MAWRPTEYLLEGELDNTMPEKVTGWMRFAGMKNQVTFDLKGDFHRDIRGATIHFVGDGREGDAKASNYMDGFAEHQTGKVGDITAGLLPHDYVRYPYIEWYGDANGRVVIELEAGQIKIIGTPLPADECQPVSRAEQGRNMAEFLAGLSHDLNVPAVAIGPGQPIVSDPDYSHWVVVEGQIVGEAHSVEPSDDGQSFAFVRLFSMPEMAEYGYIETDRLRPKTVPLHKEDRP